jgi:hypothetical protein
MTGRVVLLRTGPGPLFSVADLAVLLAGGVPAVLPDLTREQLAALWPVVRPAAVLETVGDDALAADAGHARTPVLTVDERSTRPGGTPRSGARRPAAWPGADWNRPPPSCSPPAPPACRAPSPSPRRPWCTAPTPGPKQWTGRPASNLSYLPVSHIAQRIMGHTLMCLYGTTVITSTPARLERNLRQHRADTLLGVPQVWARLAAACQQPGDSGQRLRQALAQVRTAVNGAAALDRTVAETFASTPDCGSAAPTAPPRPPSPPSTRTTPPPPGSAGRTAWTTESGPPPERFCDDPPDCFSRPRIRPSQNMNSMA